MNTEPALEPAKAPDNVIALDLSSLVPNDGNRDAYAVVISGLPLDTWLSAGGQDDKGNWTINLAQLVGLIVSIPATPAVAEQLTGLNVEVINRNTREAVQTAMMNDDSFDLTNNTVTLHSEGAAFDG